MSEELFERREVDVEINGTTYTLTERTLGDISALKSHIRKQRLCELIESLKVLDIGEAQKIKIVAGSQNYTISNTDIEEEFATSEGMIFMTWRAFLTKHPKVTHNDVIEMYMGEPDKMIHAHYALMGIDIVNNGNAEGGDTESDEPEKNVIGAAD